MSTFTFPQYSSGERLADACLHVAGITASVAGAGALIIIAAWFLPALSLVALVIYGIGLIAVFSFSAAYHLVSRPALKAMLRRFDHAAIYVKIAATYTPFALVKIGGMPGYTLLTAVWVITVFGVVTKLCWPDRLVRTSYVLYLAQGWACLAALDPLVASLSAQALVLLIAGGVLYTIGVAFHLWRDLPYHNAIWHGFVLAASACHFAAIVDAMALA